MNFLMSGQSIVWMARFSQCQSPSLLIDYKNLLSCDERERLSAFVFERERLSYLISRALIRTLLSRYTALTPNELTFGAGQYGKPYLDHPRFARNSINFNMSHTHDMAIACISFANAVGIDIESTLGSPPFEIMQDHFTPGEVSELLACSPASRAERFWSVWTLKESCIKATGDGLSAPLNQLDFSFGQPDEIKLLTTPDSPAFAKPWWFAQWRPSPQHTAALCLEQTSQIEPCVSFYECVPLRLTQKIDVNFERVSVTA